MAPEEKEQGNLLRWDGRKRGFYEVYYLKFNDQKSRTAAWIRYTLTSPLEKVGAPRCELWGIFFDAAEPANNFAVKQSHPIDRLSWGRERFRMGVADAELEMNRCHGYITDAGRGKSMSWELDFDSQTPTFYYFPWKRIYTMSFPKTKVVIPHLDARFSGKLIAGGREIDLKDAPGVQTHLWGTRHNLRWVWGHCNAFWEDDSAVFEGGDAQVKHGPIDSAHFKMFYLKTRDRELRCNALLKWLTNRSKYRLGHWEFEACNKEVRMVGEIQSDFDRFVGVKYQDPDGEELWCNNTKTASIRLKIFDKKGRPLTELTSDEGCAMELVDRRTYPEVPIQI
jgi:hypothetical protein